MKDRVRIGPDPHVAGCRCDVCSDACKACGKWKAPSVNCPDYQTLTEMGCFATGFFAGAVVALICYGLGAPWIGSSRTVHGRAIIYPGPNITSVK